MQMDGFISFLFPLFRKFLKAPSMVPKRCVLKLIVRESVLLTDQTLFKGFPQPLYLGILMHFNKAASR